MHDLDIVARISDEEGWWEGEDEIGGSARIIHAYCCMQVYIHKSVSKLIERKMDKNIIQTLLQNIRIHCKDIVAHSCKCVVASFLISQGRS